MILEATFGAGCFWCIEACLTDIEGVINVQPGYAGGKKSLAFYNEVCSGKTGHAEVARITFDDEVISFEQLLEMFWFVHNPTELNRQGNDIGSQYRSVIFYHSNEQKNLAIKYKDRLDREGVWENPIVTEISSVPEFFPAEDYHKDYLENNSENAYCQAVVRPKVDKFKRVFSKSLK